MKRFTFLLLLLACSLTAAAQSPRYTQFKEYRDEADTVRMKQMLDNWGDKDPEFYAAWANYCQVMAVENLDTTWLEMGVNWAKMGLETYPDDELMLHKTAEVLIDNEQYAEAFSLLKEIEARGMDDVTTWMNLATLYIATDDFAQASRYLKMVIQEGDEEEQAFARETLAPYEEYYSEKESNALHPDHDAIKAFSQTPAFQELTARFEACDTTLTQEEIATLYYGSSYIRSYDLINAECDDIREMAGEGRIEEAKEALKEKLKEYPVSLFLLISLFNLTEGEEMVPYVWRGMQLLYVIDHTGVTGDPDRPFQVICVSDEYTCLQQVYEMSEFLSQDLISGEAGPMDKITFLNPLGLEMSVFFRITPPYWDRLNSLSRQLE